MANLKHCGIVTSSGWLTLGGSRIYDALSLPFSSGCFVSIMIFGPCKCPCISGWKYVFSIRVFNSFEKGSEAIHLSRSTIVDTEEPPAYYRGRKEFRIWRFHAISQANYFAPNIARWTTVGELSSSSRLQDILCWGIQERSNRQWDQQDLDKNGSTLDIYSSNEFQIVVIQQFKEIASCIE